MARASSFLRRLEDLEGVRVVFVPRVAGVAVTTDRGQTLARLEPWHRREVARLGFSWEALWRAEQVHGADVAVVPVPVPDGEERTIAGVDALVSGERGVVLGIYVADCAAVYLVDRVTGALGLAHSGKKGTEGEIVVRTVERMAAEFGTRPGDVEAAISPCIRPPCYEVDIAPAVRGQLLAAGVPEAQVAMSGVCTGAEVANYYSYRRERGCTGRMLALLGRAVTTTAQP